MRRGVPPALCAFALLGCWSSESQLRTYAAYDLQCEAEKLNVREVKPDVYEVSGCGQKDNYVYNAEAKSWLKESDSGGTVVQPPP